MHNQFYLNDYLWSIVTVLPNDPMLVDRSGNLTVATTDPVRKMIFMSSSLTGEFRIKVLVHELGHCFMISYDLLNYIHRLVRPEYWIEAEEGLCNFVADYGMRIFEIAYNILGEESWIFIPRELEKLIA